MLRLPGGTCHGPGTITRQGPLRDHQLIQGRFGGLGRFGLRYRRGDRTAALSRRYLDRSGRTTCAVHLDRLERSHGDIGDRSLRESVGQLAAGPTDRQGHEILIRRQLWRDRCHIDRSRSRSGRLRRRDGSQFGAGERRRDGRSGSGNRFGAQGSHFGWLGDSGCRSLGEQGRNRSLDAGKIDDGRRCRGNFCSSSGGKCLDFRLGRENRSRRHKRGNGNRCGLCSGTGDGDRRPANRQLRQGRRLRFCRSDNDRRGSFRLWCRSRSGNLRCRNGRGGSGFGLVVFLLSAKERRQQASTLLAVRRVATGRAAHRAATALVVGKSGLVARQGLAVRRQMQGFSVREQLDQFLAAHPWPGAHTGDIKMHERRAGFRIITDATALQLHSDGPQFRKLDARDEEIHCPAEHVLALVSLSAACPAQHRVGCRRPVGRDNVDIIAGTRLAIDFPDEIEQARIHFGRLVAPPVPQKPVQLVEAGLIIAAIALEDDLGLFLGVDIIEFERARLGSSKHRSHANEGERQERENNTLQRHKTSVT